MADVAPAMTIGSQEPARTGQGWYLPRPVLRFGGKLMEQQVWCWGRDVEFPDGNLLMRFGFERQRDHTSPKRSTCYRLDRQDLHVCLWGFGMFFGLNEVGGIYLSRSDFRPKWTAVESLSSAVHRRDELPAFARPRGRDQWHDAREMWKAMLLWIAEYETWVCQTVDVAYRCECVQSWLRPFVAADRISAAWRFLSRRDWEHQEQAAIHELDQFTISKRTR